MLPGGDPNGGGQSNDSLSSSGSQKSTARKESSWRLPWSISKSSSEKKAGNGEGGGGGGGGGGWLSPDALSRGGLSSSSPSSAVAHGRALDGSGRGGFAPSAYDRGGAHVATVVADFDAVEQGQISIKAGQLLLVFEEGRRGWNMGMVIIDDPSSGLPGGLGPAGWYPNNYAERNSTASSVRPIEVDGAGLKL